MKIKFIILLVSIIIFVPVISQAMIMVLDPNLTITVNTQGEEGSFEFNLHEYPLGPFSPNTTFLNVQTENYTGFVQGFADSLKGYILTQEITPGFKLNSVSCTQENSNAPEVSFLYQPNGVIFSSNDLPLWRQRISCVFNEVRTVTKTPVLFVPGIMGTEIKNGNELLWADINRMFMDIGDEFLDPLQFNNDLSPQNNNLASDNVIKKLETALGLIDFNYTEGLVNEFVGQGYTENQDLFLFPYDWRYGVSGKFANGTTNVNLLKQKIADILQQTGSDKVDVIAHSNGGLLVKKYAMDNSTDNHIGKAIFVGVPNTGAPKAIKVLVQGDNMGVPGLNDAEMKKLAQNFPVSYDLLPSQKYYDTKGSFVKVVNTDVVEQKTIVKDLNYDEFKSYLNDNGLNSTAMANSEGLHTTSFDDYDIRTAGVDLYNIVGCKAATINKITEERFKNIVGYTLVDYKNIGYKTGDGTVPLESATNLPVSQENKFYALSADHGKMPSQDGIRQKLVNIIAGSSLSVSDKVITQDIGKCQLNGKAISVFSPVDIFVTDQNGNRLGLAEDGSIVNEIPNASFEIMGEHKFIYLPQDEGQVYTTSIKGTGVGTYTIKAENIQNSQTTQTEVFSNLPVTPELTGSINISGATTSLAIKQTPTSKVQTIVPNNTLTGQDINDYLPPVVKIKLDGEEILKDVYKPNVQVKIKAQDSGSGVLAVQYKLDNEGYEKTKKDTVNFEVKKEGKHTVTFFATDKAGNNSPEQTINFEVKKQKHSPKHKDECKKDGWRKFDDNFKNQGDCEKSCNKEGKSNK